MSVSGARAAPSEASTSTSTSSMSIHSGFQGPTVYYPPSTSMGPGGLSLRPSAPSFDPSGAGGWAPYGDGRGYAGEGVAYGYSEAQCGGDEWSRRAAGVGGPSPYPYSSQHAQQPPIQVTAPPPRPPPQPHQPSFPGSSTQQYPPLTRSGGSFPPASHPSSSSTHSAWATPRAPSLPSPALSTSSGGSSYHQLSHSHAHHPHPSSTTTDRSSSSGSVPSVTPGGYLMRFPDGGVVGFNPSPASSVSGHSTGTGAGAYAASSTSSYSAAGSTRSTSSASTSRTASSSNLRGPTSAVAAAGGSESAATRRRTSHSTSHSLSSGSAGGGSGSAAASEAGSGSGGRKGAGSEKRNGSERGGAARASDKGKECEKDVGSTTAAEGSGIIKAKSNLPLHPSLPAKPAWVTSQPPKERSTSFGSTSALAMAPSSSQDSTPSVGLADGFALAAARPASVASSLSSSSFGLPGTTQLHQHYSAAGYPSPTTYSPAPPPPHPQQQPHHLPPPGAYYGAGPPVPQPWPSRGINVNSEGYYLPPPPPPPPLPSGAPTYPDLLQQAQWTAAAPSPHDPIMQGPELRRPPPRSTALFDPNKPTAGGAGAGAGRRAGSVGRGERGVADVERGVEGLRL